MYQATTATNKLLSLQKRIRGICGGTSASKTISILLWLIDCAQHNDNLIISVVSETFPHLKRGAMRDFELIMTTHGYWDDDSWNKTDSIYMFSTGSIIEFFSADQPGKVRGPRRDILFVNEANNISYETYTQLEVRTKSVIWLDWNPVTEFWWYTEVWGKQDVDFVTLTYKDNEALHPSIVAAIEARRPNKNWWRVYGEGQLGEIEGKIYSGWEIVSEIPHEARLVRYGLDFGYTNDPTAIIAIFEYNSGFILDEIAYSTGLKNREIGDILKSVDPALVIADSAEPKSIDEIREMGINILPSQKGKDSVVQGIQFVQDQRISVTSRSLNVIKEYRNYLWMTDKDGKRLNVPEGGFEHCMDAIRYGLSGYKKPIDNVFEILNQRKRRDFSFK